MRGIKIFPLHRLLHHLPKDTIIIIMRLLYYTVASSSLIILSLFPRRTNDDTIIYPRLFLLLDPLLLLLLQPRSLFDCIQGQKEEEEEIFALFALVRPLSLLFLSFFLAKNTER